MSRSWSTLVVIALIMLVIVTGYQLYLSFTGQNKSRTYNVEQIEPNLGNDVLDFLETKSGDVLKYQDQI